MVRRASRVVEAATLPPLPLCRPPFGGPVLFGFVLHRWAPQVVVGCQKAALARLSAKDAVALFMSEDQEAVLRSMVQDMAAFEILQVRKLPTAVWWR